MARTPLWLRLVGGTLLLVTLAIALTGGFAVQLLRGYLVQRVDTQLLTMGRRPPDLPLDAVPRQGGLPGGPLRLFGSFYIVQLDGTGAVLRTIQEPPNADLPLLPRPAGGGHGLFTVESPSGSKWRAIVARDEAGGFRAVAMNLNEIDGTVSRLMVIVSGVGFAVLVALGVACYWLVRRSLRPLGEIERTAEAIASGDLSRRVPLRHPRTEMGRLGRSINGMLSQIEAGFRDREASQERMRRFMADASHELRTPLTSIRGFAELARQQRSADPLPLVRRIEDEAAKMGLLVDDLLLLARLDQERPLERRPVDLLSLAAGAVLDAQMLAPDREIDLVRLDGSDQPVCVLGDETRLRQVVGNLMRNALKHTPPGTAFRVGVGLTPGTEQAAVLEVTDDGPGLSREDAERVFERFYRADPARSRSDSGGTGLGLSIAAALVQAHGGTITAESEPGHGATFRVRLPSCSPVTKG
ncbi:HAMP domain-containing sensor histidine kinase [Planotetraspora phitsanulokensis]|uniref:histidine kinase n=1 Tax=Planotetraspora phitsanulokensis TaxID=575192 RepID=A0A8J3UE81_9ACTN|nr:HAMP domain-containing sensor histidine kinase [Planotetraspora phitsanulokensis]GII43150.1 putative sensor histidine kinase PhoR [Planotetraspora phitsanulokensis]